MRFAGAMAAATALAVVAGDVQPIQILFPGEGSSVQSPVRFDVALNVEHLSPEVRRALTDDLGAWDVCLGIDGGARDTGGGEWCARLADGKPPGLRSLARGRVHTGRVWLSAARLPGAWPGRALRHGEASVTFTVATGLGACGASTTPSNGGNTSLFSGPTVALPRSRGPALCRYAGAGGPAAEAPEGLPLVEVPFVSVPRELWLQHETEGFSTHQPALMHYAIGTAPPRPAGTEESQGQDQEGRSASVGGDLWEFGAGAGSTGLLRAVAQQTGRRLVTVEDSAEFVAWLSAFMPPAPFHRYEHVPFEKAVWERGAHWQRFLRRLALPEGYLADVVFVDSWPEESRWWVVQAFAHRARYIVVHDAPLKEFGLRGSRAVAAATAALVHGAPVLDAAHGSSGDDDDGDEDEEGEGGGSVRLDLFRRAALYPSAHCRGPASMVVSMIPGCDVAAPEDVHGLLPDHRPLD